jgi:hypothetical protein
VNDSAVLRRLLSPRYILWHLQPNLTWCEGTTSTVTDMLVPRTHALTNVARARMLPLPQTMRL